MDWFERLTGFRERSYDETRAKLKVEGSRLQSLAFGNHDDWIHAAIRRALDTLSGFALDARLVSYGTPSRSILQMAEEFD
jgi:hypothetical protein